MMGIAKICDCSRHVTLWKVLVVSLLGEMPLNASCMTAAVLIRQKSRNVPLSLRPSSLHRAKRERKELSVGGGLQTVVRGKWVMAAAPHLESTRFHPRTKSATLVESW